MARPMSRALQERLKRMGRVYSSPVVAKRQCHCEEEKNDAHNSESSHQIGECQLPEQLGCTSLLTMGQSGVDVAETLDLGCGDSQADSYCEEQLDSQLEPHSQATSEVELGNWSEQAETIAQIARTKNKVEKDSQANTCGENSVTNTVKGAINGVPAVGKVNIGLQVVRALPTEKRASTQSPVIKIDRIPCSSSNTFKKEFHSVQSSSGSPETKSCTETIVSNESQPGSDPSPVLKTCSISHLPNVSSLKGPSSSHNVASTKRPKSPIVSSSKRPASPDVFSVKRPRGSPNDCTCSAKRPVSPNNSSAERACVSPNVSSVERQESPNISKPASPPTDVMDSNKSSQVVGQVSLPGPADDDGQVSLPGPADDVDQLKKQRAELLARLNQKEELLRKLNMVKMYRAKNNLAELQVLIDKWRTVSQDALQELVDITNDPKPSLKELIDHLHLDYKFIGFDPEEETFLPS